jgi:glucose/arabinose dehydrogenase
MRTLHEARRPLAALVAVAVVGLLAGCSSSSDSSADTSAPSTTESTTTAPSSTTTDVGLPTGEPTDVTTGLEAPWSVAFVGQSALISERDSGQILELLGDGTTRAVGTVDDVVHGGEGGLLGLAVDEQQRLYAYSTGPDGNRVQRFELTGSPGSYGLGTAETIIDDIPSGSTHNGGRIAFGPDGLLYVAVGDAQDRAAAQDVDSPSGKILRMTPDGGVPDDNPFPGSLVYSYGHRNVQGLAWASDGTMFASEFGQNTWDELNIIVAGANYGWPEVEGIADADGFVNPVQQWATDEASPSGIAVVDGNVFIANLRGQVLRSVPASDPAAAATEYYSGEYGRLRAVGGGPDGSLWVVTNNTDGRGDPTSGDDRILSVPLG